MAHRSSSNFIRPSLWLACDADDAVGIFAAGKSGAVPLSVAPVSDEARAFIDEARARAIPRHDPQGRFEPGRAPGERHVTSRWEGSLGQTVVAFRRLPREAEAALASGEAERLDSDGGLVLRFRDLSSRMAAGFHEARACAMCYWPRRGPFDAETLAAAGFYPYQHLCEAWIPGPYGRAWTPREPLRLDELPGALRPLFEATRFEGMRFARSARLQPVELQACHLPDEHYMGSDGEVRLPIAEEH